ncbi:MAG: sugar transferase [Candidatus Magasanikbacteria bacterium]|nr:sugar transferase [Candidatus Magasanikbacteria bacterium]
MKRFELFLMMLKLPVDFLMLMFAVLSAYYIRSMDFVVELRPVLFDLSLADYLNLSFYVILVWLLLFSFAGLYSVDPNKKFSGELKQVFVGCSLGLAAVALYMLFAQLLFDSRFLVLFTWIFAILHVSFGRIVIRGLKSLLYRGGVGLRKVVVIGQEDIARSIIKTLKSRKELGYKVVRTYVSFNKTAKERLLKKDIDEIIFVNPRADERETLSAINFCNEKQIVFKYSADLFTSYSTNIAISALAGIPIIELKRTRLDGWGRVIKRLLDIVVSIVIVILTSPLMLLISIIILIETGRPFIYKNERVGARSHRFFVYKFRSMYQKDSTGSQFGRAGKKAEEKEKELIKKQNGKTGPIYKIANDPRVSPFGKFLRRWSLDELPNFFNVLRGQMSVVGPRPHQPREVEKYEKVHKKVFFVKPGITGLSQISGRSDLSYEEELRLDIFYIEHWRMFLDLTVLIKTPFIILKKRREL